MNPRKIALLLCLVLAIRAQLAPSPADAYKTGPIWPDTDYQTYSINPQLASLLNLPNVNVAAVVQSAAQEWNRASDFTLYRRATYSETSGIPISAVDFRTNPPCEEVVRDRDVPGVACLTYAGSGANKKITSAKVYLNSNTADFQWNAIGHMAPGSPNSPSSVDVMTIILHELGHIFMLYHNLENITTCSFIPAVMCPQPSVAKQWLHEDDRRGLTQQYGPWTSWEAGHTQGRLNTRDRTQNVIGYSGTGNAELAPRNEDSGVPAEAGTRYERISGLAQTNQAFVYFTLFDEGTDTGPTDTDFPSIPRYVTIRPGTTLSWSQYNFQQGAIGIDFVTTDGYTLRDSGLIDWNGFPVHPAARYVYPEGEWFRTTIDFTGTALEGKTIKRWYIAYDNTLSGTTGQFRAYIDDLSLSCCGHGTFTREYHYLPLVLAPETGGEMLSR